MVEEVKVIQRMCTILMLVLGGLILVAVVISIHHDMSTPYSHITSIKDLTEDSYIYMKNDGQYCYIGIIYSSPDKNGILKINPKGVSGGRRPMAASAFLDGNYYKK